MRERCKQSEDGKTMIAASYDAERDDTILKTESVTET